MVECYFVGGRRSLYFDNWRKQVGFRDLEQGERRPSALRGGNDVILQLVKVVVTCKVLRLRTNFLEYARLSKAERLGFVIRTTPHSELSGVVCTSALHAGTQMHFSTTDDAFLKSRTLNGGGRWLT